MSDPKAKEAAAVERGNWGSRLGFVMAAAGSAVGLGNVWKFPYITGENGGGLFVIIYLCCIALVGIPIMAAEIMIGRAAKKQPVAAFATLSGRKTGWTAVGWMGVLAGFVILSFYMVVAGWAMDYTLKSIVNFSEPIHDAAEKKATVYRATTPVAAMRARLAKRRAAHRSRALVDDIKREAPRSVWRGYARYRAAVGVAGGAGRAALLGEKKLAAQVVRAEALQKRVDAAREAAAVEAVTYYRKRSDDQVRAEAETVERRRIIAKKIGGAFGKLVTDGWTVTFWSALFMLLTILVVAGGISSGIERTCRFLMPTLIALMGFMVVYGAFQSGFGEALTFVFKPDPHRLKASGVLEALGHAFFTLSLGMGAMITYGSYQEGKDNIIKQSLWIAGVDTVVALLACLMIFPIIFSYGQEPGAGPGLVFKSMPLAFAEIGSGGMLLAILFFGLLLVAALTSAISMLEVVASYFIDVRGWSRPRAAWILGIVIFAFGLPSVFAFDPDFVLKSWEPTYGKSFFDTMDYLASNWMLPLGGLFVSIYAGWVLPKKIRDAELEGVAPITVRGWLLLVRWVAPILVIAVLLQKVGVLDIDEILYALFN
ncbi:MAG: sodium-dependent transporter [Myxococcales bacterium]|nr:sodium-dependent transporter [Myxococcales bacterium]